MIAALSLLLECLFPLFLLSCVDCLGAGWCCRLTASSWASPCFHTAGRGWCLCGSSRSWTASTESLSAGPPGGTRARRHISSHTERGEVTLPFRNFPNTPHDVNCFVFLPVDRVSGPGLCRLCKVPAQCWKCSPLPLPAPFYFQQQLLWSSKWTFYGRHIIWISVTTLNWGKLNVSLNLNLQSPENFIFACRWVESLLKVSSGVKRTKAFTRWTISTEESSEVCGVNVNGQVDSTLSAWLPTAALHLIRPVHVAACSIQHVLPAVANKHWAQALQSVAEVFTDQPTTSESSIQFTLYQSPRYVSRLAS